MNDYELRAAIGRLEEKTRAFARAFPEFHAQGMRAAIETLRELGETLESDEEQLVSGFASQLANMTTGQIWREFGEGRDA